MNLTSQSFLSVVVVPLAMTSSSCSLLGLYTKSQLRQTRDQSYAQGLANGTASEVRAQVHREQQEREQPPPPLAKKYYHVPIDGYQTPDGLWIEPHKAIIEVVQP